MEFRLGYSKGTDDQWLKFDVLIQEQDLAAMLSEHGFPSQHYPRITTTYKYLLMSLEAKRLIAYTKFEQLGDQAAGHEYNQLGTQIKDTIRLLTENFNASA